MKLSECIKGQRVAVMNGDGTLLVRGEITLVGDYFVSVAFAQNYISVEPIRLRKLKPRKKRETMKSNEVVSQWGFLPSLNMGQQWSGKRVEVTIRLAKWQ